MAVTFKIGDTTQTKTHDFIGGSPVIRYIAGTFKDTYDNTTEDKIISFSTIAKGTATQIREAFRDLEILLEKANLWWKDNTLEDSIWIYIQSEGSEKLRRSLIKSWTRIDNSQGASDSLLDKSLMILSDWTITRFHAWEADDAAYITHTGIGLSCNSGGALAGAVTDQTNDNDGFEHIDTANFLDDGTKDGRILRTTVIMPESTGTNDWDRIWIGMKAVKSTNAPIGNRWRSQTNFQDSYGMTKIDINANGAKSVSDALNGICTEIDFTSTAWAPRVFNQIPHTHEDSSRGSYLIIARMKVTAATSTVARVGMFHAWDNLDLQGGRADYYDDVYVENSDWHFYEMGVIQVPQEGYRFDRRGTGNEGLTNNALGIAAERVAGTGSLFIDYMTWIPQDYYLMITNAKVGGSSGQYPLYVYTTEDDDIIGHGSRTAPFQHYQAEVTGKNWAWPADPNKELLVVAAADLYFTDSESHDMDGSLEITLEIAPRYHSFNAD